MCRRLLGGPSSRLEEISICRSFIRSRHTLHNEELSHEAIEAAEPLLRRRANAMSREVDRTGGEEVDGHEEVRYCESKDELVAESTHFLEHCTQA